MGYYLWLDDYRPKPTSGTHEWLHAHSLQEFKTIVDLHGIPEGVSFDHDLNEKHYYGDFSDKQTGLDAAEWLIRQVKKGMCEPPWWSVHTMNTKKMVEMLQLLEVCWPRKKKSYVDM